MLYIVKVGTVTNAQRAKAALRRYGIKATVMRLQKPKRGDGCGYTVQVNTPDIDNAVKIIEAEKIFIRGVERV